jgi:hypothetical protein
MVNQPNARHTISPEQRARMVAGLRRANRDRARAAAMRAELRAAMASDQQPSKEQRA